MSSALTSAGGASAGSTVASDPPAALAREIERLLHESPCLSVAHPIVHHCTDHLALLAAHHEQTMIAAS